MAQATRSRATRCADHVPSQHIHHGSGNVQQLATQARQLRFLLQVALIRRVGREGAGWHGQHHARAAAHPVLPRGCHSGGCLTTGLPHAKAWVACDSGARAAQANNIL